MAIEAGPDGMTIYTGEHIALYRLLAMKSALGMEIKGIKVVRHSVYAQAKRELGFRGNKLSVLRQLEEYIQTHFPTN